jgi:DNA-binding PadR family transcriptional regulator
MDRSAPRMPSDPTSEAGFLPLPVSVLHILLALGDEEMHGYAIMRRVEELTDGTVTMGPGTLYGAVKRMLADDLISETAERPDPELDDQRRRYYRVTALGARVRTAEVARLETLLKNARLRSA